MMRRVIFFFFDEVHPGPLHQFVQGQWMGESDGQHHGQPGQFRR